MAGHVHWRGGAIVAVSAVLAVAVLLAISGYHLANRPVPEGYVLAQALRQSGFAANMRGGLPIVDHEPRTAAQADSKEYSFVKNLSDPNHLHLYALLENTNGARAIVEALDRDQYDHDYVLKQMRDARARLESIPPQELLERLITSDSALLEKSDDLPSNIETTLLLTALHPVGAAGCLQTGGQTLYVLTLADENPPGAPNYALQLYDFSPDGQERWTGSLEVPRNWTPDRTFAVLDGIAAN